MFQINQIMFFFICFIGTFVFGVPFCCLFGRKGKEEIVPYTFLMGCAQLILLVYWLSYFNIPVKNIVYIIILVGIILWAYVIYKKIIDIKSYINRKNAILLGVCVFAGLLALVPTVIFKASFPYGDGYTYLCIADYLVEHGYNEQIELSEFSPWLTQMYLYQVMHLRIGAQMLLAFWTALCRQSYSILLYAAVSGMGIAMFGFAIWMFTAQRESNTSKSVAYGVIFSVFNVPIVIWSAIFGFFPQLFGLVFMVVSLGSISSILKGKKTLQFRSVLETGIFIAVMALCYSEIIPFFVLAIVALYLLMGFRDKVWGQNIKSLIAVALMSAVLLGKYFVGMILAIISQFGAVVGGEQTINWLGYLGYWLSSVPVGFNFKIDSYPTMLRLLRVLSTLVMLALLIVGFFRSPKKDKRNDLQEFGVISLPYFLMLVYFSSVANNPFGTGIGNTWGIYKLAQYYFIIICCYLFAFYSNVFQGKKIAGKICSILFPAFFCLLSVWNTVNYSFSVTRPMYEYVGNTDNPILEYFELADMYKKEERTINLVNIPDTPRKLLTYFLRNNKLSSDWSSDGYFGIYGSGMDPKYDAQGVTLKYAPGDENSVAGMVPVDASYVDIQSGIGVGPKERLDEIGEWSWNDVISTYIIRNNTQHNNIALSFQVSCADNGPDNELDIYVDDVLYASESVNATERKQIILNIDAKPGDKLEIRLVYKGEKAPASSTDSRELSVCVWNMEAYSKYGGD